jgi:hypothetical protein
MSELSKEIEDWIDNELRKSVISDIWEEPEHNGIWTIVGNDLGKKNR